MSKLPITDPDSLYDEIESLRQQLADLHASKTRQLQAVNPFYKENEE